MFNSVPGKASRKLRAEKAVEKAKTLRDGKLEITNCQLLDYDLDILHHSLGFAPEVQEIQLTGAYLNDDFMPKLAEIINNCPNLKTLIVYNNKITSAGLQVLADSIQGHSSLSKLSITNNAIGKGGGYSFAQLITTCPITSLKVSANQLEDADVDAIASALEQNRTLHELHLSNNNFTDEGATAIAQSLQKNRSLNKLMLHGISLEARDNIGEILGRTRHPSLIELYPTCDATSSVTDTNREASYALAKQLNLGTTDLSLEEINSLYHRQTILKHCYGKHTYSSLGVDQDTVLANLDAFLESLPPLPASGLDADSLFKAGAGGYAPIENPGIWEKPENIFAALDNAGIPLSKELLGTKTPRGNSFAAAAFTFAPLEGVIAQFNQRNIQLHSAELLDEAGKPNALLAQAMARGDAKALFRQENWRGTSREELLTVLRALPEETQAQIPNRHALLAAAPHNQAAALNP